MRKIHTFVLRLLTNTDDPHALRGVVTTVATGEDHAFRDGDGLLEWLRKMNVPSSEGSQEAASDAEGSDDTK